MARQITVDIVGDSSRFNRSTTDAVNHAGKLSGGLRNSAVAGAVAGAAFGVVDKAIGFVTDAIGGASEAAKEDTASQDRLKLAYQNTRQAQELSVKQIEAIISANQAKGVSDSEQRQGISDFLDLTKNSTEAMKLNQATIELAAAKGIAYADAESMIRSAAAGRTAALKKAGVEIEKGASATEVATAVNNKFHGSLDRVAATQGGKSAIASEKMGEAQEKVGRIINKVATAAMPLIADAMTFIVDRVIPPLGKGFNWLSQNVFPVVGRVIQTLAPIVVGVFKVIIAIIGRFIDVVRSVVGIVSTVANRVGAIFRGVSNAIGRAFGAVSGIVRGVFNGIIDAINSVIRAINGIQVHVHVGPVNYDFNGLGLGYIPRLHAGGIVPGANGEDVLTMLQAGERVLPRSAVGTGTTEIHIHIDQGAYIDGPGIDMLTNRIAQRLRFAPGT